MEREQPGIRRYGVVSWTFKAQWTKRLLKYYKRNFDHYEGESGSVNLLIINSIDSEEIEESNIT